MKSSDRGTRVRMMEDIPNVTALESNRSRRPPSSLKASLQTNERREFSVPDFIAQFEIALDSVRTGGTGTD